ncbi:MAG: putative rane-anchored protein-like protein [Verrucomicrobiaceae bacterium]|nr:putative rane-anchored protein-like protein [Verrucomicrobiaceae bacterium]
MQNFQSLFFCLSRFLSLQALAESTAPKDPAQYKAWAEKFWNSIERKQGDIQLPNGVASLKIPDQFYYLNPADSARVLTEAWGNPSGAKMLGMLFPTGMNPFDADAWGVTIAYEEDGYVSDKDAADINYSDLLKDMQKDTEANNTERKKDGFEPITLVGWAAPPHYDKATHKLYWARELQFGDDKVHTLNYSIRMLGRKGVLVLNFIAGMEQKPMIESKLDQVLALANFEQGHRYEEFNPSLDKVAAYGIGGLIAGTVLTKTGLFAAGLLLLKKFGVIAVVAIGALFRKLFRSKAE